MPFEEIVLCGSVLKKTGGSVFMSGWAPFLKYELPAHVEFYVLSFPTDDPSDIVHNDVSNPIEDVYSGIQAPSVKS